MNCTGLFDSEQSIIHIPRLQFRHISLDSGLYCLPTKDEKQMIYRC